VVVRGGGEAKGAVDGLRGIGRPNR